LGRAGLEHGYLIAGLLDLLDAMLRYGTRTIVEFVNVWHPDYKFRRIRRSARSIPHLILIQFTFVSDKEELLLLASFAEANRCPESFG
jgi:hypothetical protein